MTNPTDRDKLRCAKCGFAGLERCPCGGACEPTPTPQAGDELARELVRCPTREDFAALAWRNRDRILTALTASGNDVLREQRDSYLEALRGIIGACNEAMSLGPFDCIDNDGQPYQSADLDDKLAKGRALVARAALSTTPTMSAEDMREAAANSLHPAWFPSDYNHRQAVAAIRSLPLTKEKSQ